MSQQGSGQNGNLCEEDAVRKQVVKIGVVYINVKQALKISTKGVLLCRKSVPYMAFILILSRQNLAWQDNLRYTK